MPPYQQVRLAHMTSPTTAGFNKLRENVKLSR